MSIVGAISSIPIEQKAVIVVLLFIVIASFAYPNWWTWIVDPTLIGYVWVIGVIAIIIIVLITLSNPGFIRQLTTGK